MDTENIAIRTARPEDAARLLGIYAYYVESTAITFEYTVPTVDEFRSRIDHTLERYPYLVIERNGVIQGYAYAGVFKERAAYDWNAELSVYLAKCAAGRGLGTTLYGALLALLQKQGVRNVYGIVTLPNPASEALHRAFGFRIVGAYDRSGYKNGRWLDVGIFEKQIGSFDGEPEPLQPIGAIADREEILRVYNQH